MTTISYHFRFDADFLAEAMIRYRRQHGGRRLLLAFKIFSALVLAALAVFLTANKSYGGALLFTLLIFFLGLSHRIDLWLSRCRFKSSPFAGEELQVEISEEGFRATGPKQDAKLTWALFTKVVHFGDGFLLFHGNHSFNWIPARLLKDPGQIEQLELLLRAKVSKHKIISPVKTS